MRDNAANLGLMLDSLEKLHVLIAGMNFTQFRRDIKAQRAVIMQLRIIGELAGRFSSEVSGAIDTPWREMADLHDLVSHNNLSPDIETVWQTANKSIPAIETKLKKYLKT